MFSPTTEITYHSPALATTPYGVGQFISRAWKGLTAWLEISPYRLGQHQWLEEHLGNGKQNFIDLLEDGKMSMDLYMPIAK